MISVVIGLFTVTSARLFYKLVLMQLFVALIADGVGTYLQYWQLKPNNIWVSNTYILIEFLLYTLAAGSFFFNQVDKRSVAIVLGLIAAYAILWSGCVLQNGISTFASLAYTVGGIVICLYFMAITIRHMQQGTLTMVPKSVKWFAIGTAVYYCCDIPYFSALPYLNTRYPKTSEMLYSINDILNAIRYFIVGISFLAYRTETKQKSTAVYK
jgi:hypothetical protein